MGNSSERSVDPEALPREGFDRDGFHYECSDVLREVIMGEETQALTQTETVESKNKEMETLLALLPQEKAITTEDGFDGTLSLNLNTLRTEASGYGSSTKTVKASILSNLTCCPIERRIGSGNIAEPDLHHSGLPAILPKVHGKPLLTMLSKAEFVKGRPG